MADVLLVFSITCFAVGLTFSAMITYRDFRALRERQRFISVPWQIALVTFDLVQDGLLLCCLGLTIFMMKSHRLNWAEPIASSAVQSMSATNNSDVIHTLVYKVVMLVAIAASSLLSGIIAWRRRCLHRSSGAKPNRDVICFFTAMAVSSALTTLFTLACAVTFFFSGRTESEVGYRLRFTIFTVRYRSSLMISPNAPQVCAGIQALAIYYSTAALATLACASPTSSFSPQHHGRDEHNRGYYHEGDSFRELSPYLPDVFPNPSLEQIRETQERAHGTLPNTPLPAHLSKEGITNFKLIAFNELFEVAFFFELLQNITNNVDGYELGEARDEILEDLTVILAVEELHALGANAILQANGVDPIKPCRYNFPVSDYKSAVALAATFTDVVLGALQDVNDIFAQNAENGLVRLISLFVD
ncbi:late sexual development protein [Paraphaeosphaeria minitans]|uniref:Late sexual development protein n=1 Tax=Paraphaeosphaeria minitans TaxID=565426 RepID=A0A9P6KKY7_9PLEO|nr:late sexual development protein [Paraphaeosphaeria minitans]